ncbi:MAG: HDOD domain-containing protein [Planctomycetes bacterium]|nr:HDOD domain-containing protein [Planctomycetota bacterium]
MSVATAQTTSKTTSTTPTAPATEAVVSEAIREISHIATLPEITMKIVELVESPKSTAQDLNKVISTDPALCARILKVVNSSFYGLPGQIASINRAIVMLGLNAVKNIAIAASLAKLFRGGELTPTFSAKDLWTHSNVVAAASKMIANTLKLGLADEAFLAGLIHDIGVMVEMQADRSKLIQVLNDVGPDASGAPANDFLTLELANFGATHQDFGAGLCEKWKFPKSLSTVTGFHHRPMELAFEQRTLSAIVYVADRIAAELGAGFRADIRDLAPDPAVLESLRLTAEQVQVIKNQLAADVNSLGNLLE